MNTVLKRDTQYLDSKQEIIDKLGDLSRYEIFNNEVLLAIYMRPEKTSGGIILPHQNLKEDLFQAKAHLVIKIGPSCDFPTIPDLKVYDWVVVRPSDGWALDVNGRPDVLDQKDFYPCRMAYDKHIRARIPHPGMVW